MSLNIFWFLPTHGDGHYLGTAEGARAVDHGYLQQVAQAADRLGFGGVLIPTGRSCEDSWLVAASLIPVTQRLKFLVALRPGIISPTVAARQAATLDRLSGGRALFNLVTGGDPEELAGDGLFLDHEARAFHAQVLQLGHDSLAQFDGSGFARTFGFGCSRLRRLHDDGPSPEHRSRLVDGGLVERQIEVSGIPLHVIDTAGLRRHRRLGRSRSASVRGRPRRPRVPRATHAARD